MHSSRMPTACCSGCLFCHTRPLSRGFPPVDRMTDICKNITFPQTSFAAGKNAQCSLKVSRARPWYEQDENYRNSIIKIVTTFKWCKIKSKISIPVMAPNSWPLPTSLQHTSSTSYSATGFSLSLSVCYYNHYTEAVQALLVESFCIVPSVSRWDHMEHGCRSITRLALPETKGLLKH